MNVLTLDQPPGLNCMRISYKAGSSTYVLKCWVPSPQELFQMALLIDAPLSLYSRGFFIWQSWTSALGSAIKPMLRSTTVLYFSLTHAVLKVYENRGHYKTKQECSYGFWDLFNFRGGFKHVSCRCSTISASAASTIEASQSCPELGLAAAKHKSLPTAEGYETIQGLLLSMSFLMGCDCTDLISIRTGGTWMVMLILDHSSSDRGL